jgi:cell surface protein SprA
MVALTIGWFVLFGILSIGETSARTLPPFVLGVAPAATFSPEVELSMTSDPAPPDSSVQIVMGPKTRRARYRLLRETARKTGDGKQTSVALVDTIRAPRDSAARLEQFVYVRNDVPYVDPLRPRNYPLFLADPGIIQNVDEFNPDSMRYTTRKKLGETDVREPVQTEFNDYVQATLQRTIRQNWEAMTQTYTMEAEKKKGLSDLFSKVTKIEIPIPKNPLFSIFGPPGIKLNINGNVNIHGAFRNVTSDLYTMNPLGQSRNEPDFNQQVMVMVKGEIGDKLKIDADWNTERLFEYENQLKVKYTGYEDEIVQSVEAGNVSLPVSSSFISSSQALFGIKAAFQVGPLKLTTIASQKKGQIKEMSITGGAQSRPYSFRATDYSKDHYFVDSTYIQWFDSAYVNIPGRYDPNKEIQDIEVWVTRIGYEDPSERGVVAYIDVKDVEAKQNDIEFRKKADSLVIPEPGRIEIGSFIRLELEKDFTYNKYTGVITLNRSVQPDQAIAASYVTRGKTIGNMSTSDTAKSMKLIMKLVRPKQLGPQFKSAWKLLLKNIYSLGGRGVKKEGFTLGIKYEVPGEPVDNIMDGINLLQLFNLDRYDENGTLQPDNKFDYFPGLTIDEIRGEIIFPVTEPFRYGIYDFLKKYYSGKKDDIFIKAVADSFMFGDVYDTTYNGATNNLRNKYVISGNITASTTSSYSLGGAGNIVEGSVEVIVGGVKAVPNVDFVVDYIMGTVTIKNQSFLSGGREVQIRYEANDLFQLASKSLTAARGDFDVGKQSSLGFTIMNLNQQTLSDKVRLGEEPISNTIMGIDGRTTFDLPMLTRALNWLPGIRTNAPSSISLGGELAYMKGDPNTRKSAIPQDGGAGIAYIDDFEGSRRTIPFSISFAAWSDIAPPDTFKTLDYKAKTIWYNVIPSDVAQIEIWPNKSKRRGETQVTVLNLYYRPWLRGMYNYSMNLDTAIGNIGNIREPEKAWGGITTSLGSMSTNLLDENINFIEMWVRIDSTDPAAKLYIDMGIISEDIIPNRKLDTEDNPNGAIKTRRTTPENDKGLDYQLDIEEQADTTHRDFLRKYTKFNNDPAGDDWLRPRAGSPFVSDYEGINGTEGNIDSEVGLTPDTEDKNLNNTLDLLNSYYQYEIPLVTDTSNPAFWKYRTGGGSYNWYQLRIPINDFKKKIGDPSFTTVQNIRFWISGAKRGVLMRLTEIGLVGNQWEEMAKGDTTLRVSVVSQEENPSYKSPSELPQARDWSVPDQEVYLNEQALSLIINNLKPGESRQAWKRFSARPMDVFSYKSMRMFVHGDNTGRNVFNYLNENSYDAAVFVRFGIDSLNYYEYRAPIRPGWEGNDVTIRFEDITAIKFARDSTTGLSARVAIPNGPPGSSYQVRGQPSLTNVRFISVGIENHRPLNGMPLNGEVWINELRLTDVESTPGMAYRFDTAIKFADIGSVTFNVSDVDPYFHRLEDRLGSRINSRSWAMAANMSLEKFFPQTWVGTMLSISYSHSEAISDPKYMPGTDIAVDQATVRAKENALRNGKSEAEANTAAETITLQSQSLVVSETFSIPQIKVNIPSDSWLITETINRMAFSYSYNSSQQRNPAIESYSNWAWSSSGSYGLEFSPRNYITPVENLGLGDFFLFSPWKKAKIYFSPRNFSLSAALSRTQTQEQARFQAAAKPVVRSFTASRAFGFTWQMSEEGLFNPSIQYQVSIASNLTHLETTPSGLQRSFSNILGDIINANSLVNFGTDLSYSQTIAINPRMTFMNALGIDKYLNFSTNYNVGYRWANAPAARELGKSVGWSNGIAFTPELNLKALSDVIWSPSQPRESAPPDTGAKRSLDPLKGIVQLSRILIKYPIFDFERFGVTFTQSNSVSNSGVLGDPGFMNLFGRVPFVQSSLNQNGPSLWYQLGLSGDPHGEMTFKTKSSFPFFEGIVTPGLRARGGNLVDNFSQSNSASARVSRQLWEGARIDLNWTFGTNLTISQTMTTDSLGIPVIAQGNRTVSGNINRTFITFPSTFVFKFFKTGVEEVYKKFNAMKDDLADTRTDDQKLSDAFESGMEGLPLVTKIFGKIMPRANWSFRWEGLEKLPLFSSIATRVGLEHTYSSNLRRNWKISPDGIEVTEGQSISYQFQPLIGLNFTFKQLGGGNFGGQVKYSTQSSYNLATSAQNITENNTNDISVQANYNKTGFEIPFLGYSLSNDLDMSVTYTRAATNSHVYDVKLDYKDGGTPMEGTIRTTLEPRLRYVMSSRLTLSVYYKYMKLEPDQGGSRIPGSTTNEGGFDVQVQISQ